MVKVWMHFMFYWTGALVWVFLALALVLSFVVMILVPLGQAISLVRWLLRTRTPGDEATLTWGKVLEAFLHYWKEFIFEQTGEFRHKDGMVWRGIGRWTLTPEERLS